MSSSPLLDLPAELQNRIYELVVVQVEPDIVSVRDSEALSEQRDALAPLSTCHGIRAIAKPTFYGKYILLLGLQRDFRTSLEGFFVSLEQSTAKLCRDIRIESCVRHTGRCDFGGPAYRAGYCTMDISIDSKDESAVATNYTDCCGFELRLTREIMMDDINWRLGSLYYHEYRTRNFFEESGCWISGAMR